MNPRQRFIVNFLFCAVFGGIIIALYPSSDCDKSSDPVCLSQLARQPVSEPLATTFDIFAGPTESVFRIDAAGHMRVFLTPTPAKFPPETRLIYARATSNVPTRLVVRNGEISVELVVESMSPAGEFVIPCLDKEHCRRILHLVGWPIPLQLQSS